MDAGQPGLGPLDELGARLGILIREPELIRQAFVHSSFFNENPELVPGHNERLEFYGDAVIGVAVSRLLFERFPDEDEGFLTARRAALVNREALAGATRPSVLAACFEALAGALALTEGTERAEAILQRLFAPQLDALAGEPGPPKSAKSLLQEWTQRHRGVKPAYRLIETTGPPHDHRFQVAVVIDGRTLGTGAGSSRQRAEEQAAQAALLVLPAVPEKPVGPTAS